MNTDVTALLIYYILQVDADYRDNAHEAAILAGRFQPNANDRRLTGMEKISDVWPEKPSGNFVNIFIHVSSSQ
jgi:hypothetical protein